MITLLAGLVLFFGMHSVSIVSRRWRDSMVKRMGPTGWRLVYSVISILGFYLIVRGYSISRHDPYVLYETPQWLRYVSAALMLPVFPLLIAAYLPGRIKAAVKHPMLTATKAWALSHLLVNGMLADVLLFGGFLAWAVIDRISAGKRPQPAAATATPSIRNDVIAVVLGLVLYVAFAFWAHPRWIGVPVMP